MKIDNFFVELKRRNVYKVASRTLSRLGSFLRESPRFFRVRCSELVIRLIVVLIILRFSVAVVSRGYLKSHPKNQANRSCRCNAPTTGYKKHAWIYIVVIGGIVSIALFFLGGYMARNSQASSNELAAKSIAVLPFENLSRDPDNAYFCEGVQDEILTRLAKVADLKVIRALPRNISKARRTIFPRSRNNLV